MTFQEIAVLWTARGAVVCMLIRMLLAARHRPAAPTRAECIVWTAGCILFLLHVWAAFQFRHYWSHSDAYHHTAAQTADVTGWNWGGGLYLNYLFTLLWVADAASDWRAFVTGRIVRPRVRLAVRGFLAFMAVNATLVFGPPGWWIVAAITGAALLAMRRGRPAEI